MTVKMHRLSGADHFDRLRQARVELSERMLGSLKRGTGDFQICNIELMRAALDLGAIALILGRPDGEAGAEFRRAAAYGLTLLTGSGTSHSFTSHEMQVDPEETGGQLVTKHEHHFAAGDPLDPTYYLVALTAITAFGTEDERLMAAGYPEDRYRSPSVTVDESLFLKLRALKSLLEGDEEAARREGLAALKACRETSARPGIMALVSLNSGDGREFREHLEEAAKAYGRMYQKRPNSPEGFVYLFGLALCRLAVERGIIVEDGPYLPTRLLPEAGGRRVH